jgi:hypothetical protein
MVKVMLPYREGGGLPVGVVGALDSLISLIHNKFLGRYAKHWIFTKIIFFSISFQSQCMVI